MKLWGGRFSEDQSVLMKQFNDSFRFDQRLYAVDIQGSQVYTDSLHLAGLLTDAERSSIQQGLEKIEGVKAATASLSAHGLLHLGKGNVRAVNVLGIEPEKIQILPGSFQIAAARP